MKFCIAVLLDVYIYTSKEATDEGAQKFIDKKNKKFIAKTALTFRRQKLAMKK